MVVIEHLPPSIFRALPEIALLLVGVFVERHYISRVAVFTNITALAIHYISIQPVADLYTLYVEIGILLGVYGFIQYLREVSIGQAFYVTTFYLYSSLTVGAIIFLPLHPFWSLVAAIIVQMGMAAAKGGVSAWVYAGPRPADIQWFIDNKVISCSAHRFCRHNRPKSQGLSVERAEWGAFVRLSNESEQGWCRLGIRVHLNWSQPRKSIAD